MLSHGAHFQQQLIVKLRAHGGVLRPDLRESYGAASVFTPPSLAHPTLLCYSWPLVKKKSPRGHDGSPQIFEGLS